MTDDLIDSTFGDLDMYYPGSKRKRKSVTTKKVKEEVSDWTANPIRKTLPNGRDMEFYTIGALAVALGRPLITIRYWMKEGYLPAPSYRLGDKIDAKGKEIKGRRLYSRAQIEEAVRLFALAGVLDKTRISWPNQKLTDAISEAWNTIRAAETKDN
jgi:hypothetical protein